ncbi:MAG: hypothetical protein AB1714_18035 [Acidobacteriota bacterium]
MGTQVDTLAGSGISNRSGSGDAESTAAGAFQPRTDLGRRLWQLRQQYIAGGGRLYSAEEIQAEIDRQRSRAPGSDEDDVHR